MNARSFYGGFALALLVLAPPAYAQYMYLDSNGDGAHTGADKLHPVAPTVVDIWFDTAHNRDGSATSCHSDPTIPLGMFSYLVNLKASGGTVSYSSYTNRVSGMSKFSSPPASDGTQFSTGPFAGPSLPPGRYLMGTLSITVTSGFPTVTIVPYLDSPFLDPTLFGSHCDENPDMSNSIVLGRDWSDVDGLARPGHRGASFAPNPINPTGDLRFATEREGSARIRLFDLQGRMVRTLLDTPRLAAGPHAIRFDGRDLRGAQLPSGVYYYRVESTAGVFEGQIAILK